MDVDRLFQNREFVERLKQLIRSEAVSETAIDKLIETMRQWRKEDHEQRQRERQEDHEQRQRERQEDHEQRQRERQEDHEQRQRERQEDHEQRQRERNQDKAHMDIQLGTLGARWGLKNERTWRNALKTLLSISAPDYTVQWFEDQDPQRLDKDGRPVPVELDIVALNGVSFIVEIKGHVRSEDVDKLARKVEFVKEKKGLSEVRVYLIAPIVDENAKKRAHEYGYECVDDPEQFVDELSESV
ncbi:hypothetical protein P9112_005506 [Eukaryota sp. TZLM1-RC]